jgi:prolipoprotein diacylglyceryltransferase
MRLYVLHWLEGYMRGDIANLLAPSWFTCVGLAGLVGLVVMLALARRRGLDAGSIASVLLCGYVAAVVAGIVVPMLIDGVEAVVTTGHFHLHWAGMTSFWGYLAGGIAVTVVCRREGLPLARVADLAVIPLGIALMFARLGCFMAGCDYGKVTSLPWAVRFPAGSPAWHDHVRAGLIASSRTESLPVHPTQLYEAALGIAIVVIALVLSRRKRNDGQLFVVAAATYAIGRLAIETVRGDAGRGIYGGLSSGQIFSMLVLLAIGMRFLVTRRRVATAMAAVAFVLAIVNVGEADAQPVPDVEPLPPSATPPLDWAERPMYSTGILFGVSTPLNRRADQVPTLAGPSISLGYLPGRFGVWIDLDTFANSEATHGTFLIAGSFTQRLNHHLTIGGRLGIGATEVNFKDPAFQDVVATTLRAELISEIVLARHWAIWIRPLTIDTLTSAELGGPITTYQFRIGFAYRFGSRHNAVPVQPLPPLGTFPPPAGPPSLPPDPPIGAQ